MTKAEIMPLFLILLVVTWLLYIPAIAVLTARPHKATWAILLIAMAALAVVTLDTIRRAMLYYP